jgi:CheY-like chemotaxis protein
MKAGCGENPFRRRKPFFISVYPIKKRMNQVDEIVLIEDNPIDSELAIKALRKSGLIGNIRVLCDGADALDYFFRIGQYRDWPIGELPKFILLDLKIPKVNGLELLSLIRSNRFTRTIPIIIFSSSAVSKDIDEAYKKGVNSYLVKPIDYKEYSTVMEALCTYWINNNKRAY